MVEVCWFGLRVGADLASVLQTSDEMSECSQWLIVLLLLLLLLNYYYSTCDDGLCR